MASCVSRFLLLLAKSYAYFPPSNQKDAAETGKPEPRSRDRPLTFPRRHGVYPAMSTVVRNTRLWWRTS
jgi:hypothetical protein